MAIPVNCDCGATYQVPPERAGQKFRCRECDATLTVPRPRKRASVLLFEESTGRHWLQFLVDARREVHAEQPAIEKFHDRLLEYLSSNQDFRQSELRVLLTDCGSDEMDLAFSGRIEGTVNDRPFRMKFDHELDLEEKERQERMIGGLSGGLAGRAVSGFVNKGARGGRISSFYNNACQKVFLEATGKLDRHAGRKAAPLGNQYWMALAAGPLAVLIVTIVMLPILNGLEWKKEHTFVDVLVFAATLGAPWLLGGFALGLWLLPARFFTQNSRGQKLMAQIGAINVTRLRLISCLIPIGVAVVDVILFRALGEMYLRPFGG